MVAILLIVCNEAAKIGDCAFDVEGVTVGFGATVALLADMMLKWPWNGRNGVEYPGLMTAFEFELKLPFGLTVTLGAGPDGFRCRPYW